VHIPAKYYERIPAFYFIVGILLLANSVYLGLEEFAAYFYLAFGCVSILYAVGVKKARERHRTEAEAEAEPESEARELS
jgi:hypothetical protein